jgi:predicted RNA-binding protein YlxR (DUF448 family)
MMKSIKPRNVVLKHVPQRTCVACGGKKAKRELVRLVRDIGGTVDVDTGGKKTGRGAYICWRQECWEAGIRGKKLERKLRTTISSQNREHLVQYGESLYQETDNGQGN